MRKLLLSVVASLALVAVAPATALAQRHHHRSHVRHARIHHKRFGSAPGSATSGMPSAGQTAGTVQSFTGGVLTILLSDGKTTVSGRVTPDTAIQCRAPEPTGMKNHDRGQTRGGDDQGDNNGRGDDDQSRGDDEHAGQSCGSSALTAGAVVQEAELNISGGGAVWQKVELVSASSTSGSSSGGGD